LEAGADAVEEGSSGADAPTSADAPADEPAPDEPALAAAEPGEPAEPADEPVDPLTEKRLAKIQAAEKRAKETLAKERAELERLRAEKPAPDREYEEFKALKARAATDPMAILRALGMDPEHTAKVAWQHHLAEKEPNAPQHREIAARLQREKEESENQTAQERRLAELEAKLEQRDQQAQYASAWQSFYGDVVKTATAETSEAPLLKTALAKNPTRTAQRIERLAHELFRETGEWPDAADVLATYETQRRAELEEHGIDVATVIKQPKKPQQEPEKKRPGQTLTPDLSTTTAVPRNGAKSIRERRAETLALLEAGKLD
jgi:hypothetical protein